MASEDRKILIIDEAGFTRVCRAILEDAGCLVARLPQDGAGCPWGEGHNLGLVIVSYPYGVSLFAEIAKLGIPIIVLADHISRELIALLEELEKSFCMIKPLDFLRFKSLAVELVSQELPCHGGYRFV
jgi:hypothetical protein